jgi:ABC-type polar amino acid transport system ATPase subunit
LKGDRPMIGTESGEKTIIKVRGLHKYFGPIHVIKGVNLDVRPSEVVVIIGPSGGGKSTFLRCLNFLEEPSAGTIEIDGMLIDAEESAGQRHKRIREIRRKAAMIFQEFNLFQHMTVLENIIEGAVTVKGVPKKQAIAKAEELLASMGLLAKRDDFPSRLAAGEQQQVAIARSLCMEPQIMLFDDPTSALDPSLVSELVDVMARLANEGVAMIVVTNEPYLARNIADRVILLDDGVWVEMAPPDELFTNPKQERTRQFLTRISLKDISSDT